MQTKTPAATKEPNVPGGRTTSVWITMLIMGMMALQSQAIIVVNPSTNEAAIASAIQQGAGGVTNVTATVSAQGTNAALSSGLYLISTSPDTYGLTTNGLIISTGNVSDYDTGANSSTSNTTAYGVAATSQQNALLLPVTGSSNNFDVTQIDVTFDVLPNITNLIFQVVFGTEEFPENVSNDGLVLLLNGVSIGTIDGSLINIDHPGMTNALGTELDAVIATGGTNALHIINAAVTPGSTNNTLTILIADSDDAALDSTAYLTIKSSAPVVNTDVDLDLSKIASPEPVTVGSNLTYTISVTNISANIASGVTVTDALPTGVTFVSATPNQGTCTNIGGVVTCDLGTVSNSAAASIALIVVPTTPGSITNSATAASVELDTNSTNNTDTAISTVNAATTNVVDLTVTKTDSPDPVTVGSNLTYTIVVTNAGPSGATGVSVNDTLDGSLAFVSATPGQGTCTNIGGVVTCDLGSITNGASASIALIVTPQVNGIITNSATASSSESDSNPSDNTGTSITTVNAALVTADLAITKTDAPDPVGVSSNLTYTIVVTNLGPQTATGVTVTDSLPLSVTLTSSNATQGTITVASNVVTASVGSLAANASATITLGVVPNATGSITNIATVAGIESDNNLTNNTATAVTTVTGQSADLSVTKRIVGESMVGCGLTYLVTVSNHGPNTATSVVLTDTLPASLLFVDEDHSQGTFGSAGNVLTFSLGTLANGASATVTLLTLPVVSDTITNTASVTATQSDGVSGNNTATVITSFGPPQNVSFALSKLKQKCKTKNNVTTCSLGGTLEAVNGSGALSRTHVEFFLSTNATFEPENDEFITEAVVTASAGKTGKLKLKESLDASASGLFLLAVDDNDNVLASALIP